MSRIYLTQTFPPLITADGPTVTAAALATISPAPDILLAALGPLEAGFSFEWSAFGRITTAATPGTWTFGLYIGTSTIASGQAAVVSAALAAKASMTNVTWRLEGNATIRAIGTGTTATVRGCMEISNITSNGTDLAPATAPADFGFDSTVANVVRLGITPSVATGSIICHQFRVRGHT
jgi:hypothetical protein